MHSMDPSSAVLSRSGPPLWMAMLLAAFAGGMGWGIRGQYGHETGAMIAGSLVSLVLVFLFCPRAASLPAARAVAWGTIGISFGGSMTYGQTIGLTHDAPLIGNWAALRWGMLGLGIKGAIWIGFAGLFLGMGLSGKRYRPWELLLVMLGAMVLFFAGLRLLNSPFEPANKLLPKIYFSDDWYWEPGSDLKPRREVWGGLLVALVGVTAYVGTIRKDRLARNLALWACLGGAIGFPLGQCIQAGHAWNPAFFRQGWFAPYEPHINWWNMMETTFGAVMAAVMALGLWFNRHLIDPLQDPGDVSMSSPVEWLLVGVHVSLTVGAEFFPRLFVYPMLGFLAGLGLSMGIIPIVGVAGGRFWPYLLTLPILALPIAGKTLRELSYRSGQIPPPLGWLLYMVLPLAITLLAALWFARRRGANERGRVFTRRALLLNTWLYFGLNYAFFRFPLPWNPWTGRTPNAIIFTICAVGLTLAALAFGRTRAGSAPDDIQDPRPTN